MALDARQPEVAYLDDVLALVLRALDGDVLALMRARAVNGAWNKVCAHSGVFSAVRWPLHVPVSDDALALMLRLSVNRFWLVTARVCCAASVRCFQACY